MSLCWNRRTQ